tara:strand:- start:13 stop:423 length:411 start_codon:yes stop_codon:yes gene_type:complete
LVHREGGVIHASLLKIFKRQQRLELRIEDAPLSGLVSSTSHQHRKLCTGQSVSKALRDGEKFVVIDQGWSCHTIEISAHELHILLSDERANFDNVLNSAWTKEGWVDHVKTVRRGHDEHAVPGFGTVHEGEQQRRD